MDNAAKRFLLPIGEQSFSNLRQDGCYYVDKTPLIGKLISQGKYYFLSRPRRFGKSLLVDTLHELFQCNEELFRGLDIHKHWDWSVRYPVVRISFDRSYEHPDEIDRDINEQLRLIEKRVGLDFSHTDLTALGRFREILEHLNHTTGQRVVVLVDEYDKPILDALDDLELAQANRKRLAGFYGAIKGSADYIRFVFVTGISMFSGVSLFSGFNNLEDISLDPMFATICGFTESEMKTVFAPELERFELDKVRHWYNGYSWLGDERVYNPFDVLLLFRKGKFQYHWYRTGQTSYLLRLMEKTQFNMLKLGDLRMNSAELSNFDVDRISTEALLFQSGYLTIAREEMVGSKYYYHLDYPNFEVRMALNQEWISHFGQTVGSADAAGQKILNALADNDFDLFGKTIHTFFSEFPHQSYRGNDFAGREVWYASMLNSCLLGLGMDIRLEESTRHGQSDMVLNHGGQIFVFEFKVVDSGDGKEMAKQALAQIRARGYADKYRHRDLPIHLVGLVFSKEDRNVAGIQVETI